MQKKFRKLKEGEKIRKLAGVTRCFKRAKWTMKIMKCFIRDDGEEILNFHKLIGFFLSDYTDKKCWGENWKELMRILPFNSIVFPLFFRVTIRFLSNSIWTMKMKPPLKSPVYILYTPTFTNRRKRQRRKENLTEIRRWLDKSYEINK